VGVVAPDGKASRKLVKVGPKVGPYWLISEGLNPGDKVIVEGLQKVRPDASGSCPVVAKPWTPPPGAGFAPPAADAAKPTEVK
jgi:membrane fusion protein (multidrug efflux system)